VCFERRRRPLAGVRSRRRRASPVSQESSVLGIARFAAKFDRRQQPLFIDARKLGTLVDRVHRELTDADIEKITGTYHPWRGDKGAKEKYADVPGYGKSTTMEETAAHGHVLTPGRYVGAEKVEDDGEPFEEKMPRLVAELHAQFAESAKLEKTIKANLKGLGYGG
jgi:type I restriction enzyme M protein